MIRKISYEKGEEKPYHVQKPHREIKNEWYDPGKRYNERGIRDYITTATLEEITLETDNEKIKKWIKNETSLRVHSINIKNLIKIINSNT